MQKPPPASALERAFASRAIPGIPNDEESAFLSEDITPVPDVAGG